MGQFPRRAALAASLAVAAILGGCATTYVSPVDVTRFVGSDPALLGTGPVAVRAGQGMDPQSLEYSVFQTAVAEQLADVGYIVVGGDAPQVAEITVRRSVAHPGRGRSPVNVGVGGSAGSYRPRVGVGLGVGLNLAGAPADRVNTELRVMIRPSAGGSALWEGRANFSATVNSRMADAQASASKLAQALFAGFPGRSGETIQVR